MRVRLRALAPPSLRTTLAVAIMLMGVLGLILAIATGEIYRGLALENQRLALVELVRLKVDDLLRQLDDESRDLALALQAEPAFEKAHSSGNRAEIIRHLDRQFHQYFVTTSQITLSKLRVFDEQLTLVAQSTDGGAEITEYSLVCPSLIRRARGRTGVDRVRPLAALCVYGGRPYHASLVPIGGLRPSGYLEVLSDPSPALVPIESALGMPVQLRHSDGHAAYESRTWADPESAPHALIAEYTVAPPAVGSVLTVAVASNITPLHEQLAHTRILLMLVAGVLTLAGVGGTLLLLQRSTLRPLDALTRQLRRLHQDRQHLGEQLTVEGTAEIRELARDFNEMSLELADLYSALEHMAFTDALTRLPNRSRFHEQLQDFTTLGREYQARFALLLMDLDRFKGVNDTLGHHVGDHLLQMVGTRLEQVLREGDLVGRLRTAGADQTVDSDRRIVARLGGDEFAALVGGVGNRDEASTVARKLLKAMEQPFMVEGSHFNIGMSIGIVLYPEHGSDKNTLLRRADIAMYNAKNNQRGYAFYDTQEDHHSLLKLTLETDLRHAIENDQLDLYYQPKIHIKSGEICGVEALVRWPHPERGYIPPDQFIPVAEQGGLIHPLTLWVLGRALRDCAKWQDKYHRVGVSINLSTVNFHDSELTRQIANALRLAQVDPQLLTLELTESTVMADADHAVALLSQLDAMGVNLSIDDFGTGYSSLSYLKRFPVDEVKIDKSFVIEMKENRNDAVIVRSTIDLAHNMGLKVVAEGVESADVLERLATLGCDMAQGYFVSHPLPLAHLQKLLREAAQKSARLDKPIHGWRDAPKAV